MSPLKVLLVEVGTSGGGHARTNLSVLLSLHHAWPKADLILACSTQHHAAIQDRMRYCNENVPNFTFIPLAFDDFEASSHSTKLARLTSKWFQNVTKVQMILKLAKLLKTDVVVDLWADGPRLLAIKFLKRLYLCQRVIFLHFVHNWDKKSSRSLKRWLLPRPLDAVGFGSNRLHGYALLHARMRTELSNFLEPSGLDNFFEFNYPICWPRIPPSGGGADYASRPRRIRFGYVSPSFKGLNEFVELVKNVHSQATATEWPLIEFRIVGKIIKTWNNKSQLCDLENLGVSISEGRLSEEAYASAIADLDYAIHVYDENNYRIRFSSSLQDTVAFFRPAIMTRTGFATALRDLEPEYGYCVESVNEAADTVVQLFRNFNEQDFSEAVERAVRLRDYFSVGGAAQQMRAGFELVAGRSL